MTPRQSHSEGFRTLGWLGAIAFGLLFPLAVSASSAEAETLGYKNGWTEHQRNIFIANCTEEAVKGQLQFMYNDGRLKKDATEIDVRNATSNVTPILADACDCAQRRVMSEYTLDDGLRAVSDPAFTHGLMADCEKRALQHRR